MRVQHMRILAGLLLAVSAAAVVGCREHMPHSFTWPGTGDTIPTHPKPPEGGYYSDWDPYAATIEITPLEAVNPVRTQHILIATVRDKDGKPLPNRRVEWMIAEGSIGSIVEVDESGWRAARGYKMTNSFAVSHTNNFTHTLTRGTDDPSDDVNLEVGQTWCVITSPIEGDTHIIAYAPAIYDWTKHKAFAVKHWYDVSWECPGPATNMVGTPHELITRVFKHSDGSPLAGYNVTYKLLSGPGGRFDPGSANTVSVPTDEAGIARVVLNQDTPMEGVNDIQIDINRPENIQCCKPGAHIATCNTTKTWLAPQIDITKSATPRAEINEEFDYSLVVSNPARMEATNVQVRDTLPDGIVYVSSNPAASVSGQMLSWSLGNLGGGQSYPIGIRVRATRTGTFHNCADVTADGGLSDNACADTVVTAPSLALVLHCQTELMLCDNVPFRVVVSNNGDGTARNVVVTVDLPDGLASSDGRNQLSFSAGDLGAGQSKEATFNAKAARVGDYGVRASATAEGGLTADSSCSTRIVSPNLSVTKTGPDVRYIGRPATYTLTVTNTGSVQARDTVLVDTIPAGLQFISASDGGQMSGGRVTWSLGTLEAGASRTVSVELKTTGFGNVVNTATVQAFCAEANASYTMEVKGVPAILLEVIDVHDPIEVGGTETYEIVVTNQGSAPDINVRVQATLPPEFDYVSADGPTQGSVEGRTVTFAPYPSLAPKQRIVYKVMGKANATGDTRFTVVLTSDMLTTPVQETESTHVY